MPEGYIKIDPPWRKDAKTPPNITYDVAGEVFDDWDAACERARERKMQRIEASVDGERAGWLYVPRPGESDRIMRTLEGVCPHCGFLKLEIVRIGGVPEFLEQYTFDGSYEKNVWEPSRDGIGEMGAVFWQCMTCGERAESWAWHGGDWT